MKVAVLVIVVVVLFVLFTSSIGVFSASANTRDDCFSSVERPCYMRGAKAPLFWVKVGQQGGENSYNTCLSNPNLVGEFVYAGPTPVCEKGEIVKTCYQGSGFAIFYLDGECVKS